MFRILHFRIASHILRWYSVIYVAARKMNLQVTHHYVNNTVFTNRGALDALQVRKTAFIGKKNPMKMITNLWPVDLISWLIFHIGEHVQVPSNLLESGIWNFHFTYILFTWRLVMCDPRAAFGTGRLRSGWCRLQRGEATTSALVVKTRPWRHSKWNTRECNTNNSPDQYVLCHMDSSNISTA